MADYADLIGVPFAYGGRGPDSYDCYGLLREMWRRTYGVVLPDVASPTEPGQQQALMSMHMSGLMAYGSWQQVPRQPGVAAAIRVGTTVSHCGFLLDEHTLIHAWQRSAGVGVQRIEDWNWSNRIVGFYRFKG